MKRTSNLGALIKCLAFSVVAIVFAGTVVNAQYTILNPVSAPPGGPGGQANANDFNGGFTPIQGIETGIRFKVTQVGTITAIRFYKGTANTGTHIGHIWEPGFSTVTPRRTVTFTGETASGWQQMNFGTAFTAVPGTIYVAAVHSSTGHYAYENGTGVINPSMDQTSAPFIVLAGDGSTGGGTGNGSYLYTATPAYPSNPNGSGYNSTNFFIDVRFTPTFALPVTISDLRAVTTNRDIAVSWKTSNESNNKGFEIQRSNNNADWYAIGFVNGAGESATTRSYGYSDKSLAPGLYYYRLKQIDQDGKFKISSVVTATVAGKGAISLFQNYPNPFNGSSSIRFDLPAAQKIRLSIFDMSGREVKVIADNSREAGSHIVSFDSKGLSRQIYSIRLSTENGTLTKQILVQ